MTTTSVKPPAILLVDDIEANLVALEATLQNLDCEFVRARSGNEALRLLLKREFAVMLLDVQMPEMDGYEVARYARENTETSMVPIIFVTATHETEESMLRGYGTGAVDFVFKPINAYILRSKVRVFLELHSAHKEAERALAREAESLARSNEGLRAARAAAESASRAKSDFLAMMSHELRTPLNSIIGFSEVLLDAKFGPLNERQTKYLKNVLQSGRHLLGLIDDFLDFSKIEAGRLEVLREPCAARAMAGEAAATLQPLADAKQITLALDPDDALPVSAVTADAGRLKQVLYNLLSNAIKFTPPGGRIDVRCTPRADRTRVRIAVTDTGTGISPADLERLFKPFTQLENAKQIAARGTGLGLALTKQLVELMGGEIGVESEVGVGSTFYVELATDPAWVTTETRDVDVGGTSPLALIVDDEPEARELLEIALRDLGYRTIAAVSGEEALALARRHRPDVITLDVRLPGLDGWEALRILGSDPETRQIPVLMTTILGDRAKALSIGAVDHLVKPFERRNLVEALRRLGFAPDERPRSAKLLVVDDDPGHLDLVRAELEPHGFQIETAMTGHAGLELAMTGRFDLVLIDLALPDLSGAAVSAALRKNERTQELPILLITGKDLSGAERERLSGDVEAVLMKTAVRADDLVREIHRVLRRPV